LKKSNYDEAKKSAAYRIASKITSGINEKFDNRNTIQMMFSYKINKINRPLKEFMEIKRKKFGYGIGTLFEDSLQDFFYNLPPDEMISKKIFKKKLFNVCKIQITMAALNDSK